jgi:hypothetical protein
MSLSLGTLLRKARKLIKKGDKLEWLRRLLDRIPESLLKRLDAIKLSGGFGGKASGEITHIIDKPGEAVRSFGTKDRPPSSKNEMTGTYQWEGAAVANLDELLDTDWVSVKLRAEARFDMRLTLGMMLDFEKERVGGYTSGRFSGLTVSFSAELPRTGQKFSGDLTIIGERTIKREEFTVDI